MKRAIVLLLCLLPRSAAAQLVPNRHHLMPQAGPSFATQKFLENTVRYRTFRESDPENLVITEIGLDPGLFTGLRYVYSLTRHLAVEAEFDFGIAVFAIRQLEIKPDSRPGDLPQYEDTTTDARIFQYSLNLSYFPGTWRWASPFVVAGIGSHDLDLRKRGVVDPDPIHDRMGIAGLGILLHAGDRLGVRVELRDSIYKFSFDNQFVDPAQAPYLVDPILRPDFYRTTSIAGPKLQHDVALTLGFMVHPF